MTVRCLPVPSAGTVSAGTGAVLNFRPAVPYRQHLHHRRQFRTNQQYESEIFHHHVNSSSTLPMPRLHMTTPGVHHQPCTTTVGTLIIDA
ncbi:hypothetical protein BDN67DRAFT_127671 [Paxillus ammoniavirescens]|nr:hypothetical protein BDN67DRAFT_127671 [Paxillus ammoniavirescens]